MTLQTILKAAVEIGIAHNHGAGGEFILVAKAQQLVELEARLQGGNVHVPGVMRCDGCKFELTRVNLNVNVGTVTAGNNEPEPCPNGCGPLRPVTWRERALQAEKWGEEQFERANALAAGRSAG